MVLFCVHSIHRGDSRIFLNGGSKTRGGGMGKIKWGDIKMALQKCLDIASILL